MIMKITPSEENVNKAIELIDYELQHLDKNNTHNYN